jgi:hypothetical protein
MIKTEEFVKNLIGQTIAASMNHELLNPNLSLMFVSPNGSGELEIQFIMG